MKQKLFFLLIVTLIISSSASAQTTISKISGTITETTGETFFGGNIIAL